MGRMFSRVFKSQGKRVVSTDLNTARQEEDLVRQSDLIIISVPIDVSESVVRRVTPWLTETQILSDFCSVKNRIVPAMIETKAILISCHPMFGYQSDLSKQNLILIPVREKGALAEYKQLYLDIGLNVVTIDNWKKHDEYMSVIQGLMHFFHIVFTQTLRNRQVDLSTLLSICSPIYQANFALTCRILLRDPRLYTHILMDNPENVAVLNGFIDQANESLRLIENKDESTFIKAFEESRDFLGNFGPVFNGQSDFLVEKIKEFTIGSTKA